MQARNIFEERDVTVYEKGQVKQAMDTVVIERYLRIRLNGREVVRLASSPLSGQELAAGYLISEGHIEPGDRLVTIDEPENDLVDLIVEGAGRQSPQSVETIYSSQGRGYEALRSPKKQIPKSKLFTPRQLLAFVAELESQAATFKQTGGAHSAGLGSPLGLIKRYEDIGRHNAVDKVFGHAYLNNIPLHDKCLVLSGRVAFEIMQKAAFNQVPLIVSRAAPTLLAVDRARELGITVVGFARGERFNVYSHPERIDFA